MLYHRPKGGGFVSGSGRQNSLEINSIFKNWLAQAGAVSPQPERYLKMSKHTQVEGSIPGWGMYRRQPINVSLSLSKINNRSRSSGEDLKSNEIFCV